jgi:hypothetical protein
MHSLGAGFLSGARAPTPRKYYSADRERIDAIVDHPQGLHKSSRRSYVRTIGATSKFSAHFRHRAPLHSASGPRIHSFETTQPSLAEYGASFIDILCHQYPQVPIRSLLGRRNTVNGPRPRTRVRSPAALPPRHRPGVTRRVVSIITPVPSPQLPSLQARPTAIGAPASFI